MLSKVKVHKAAQGFRKKRSIISNATPHLGKNCLLKMDMANFFPSISLPRVIKVFRILGYPPNVSFYLGRLCCLDDVLPQGAATSPALSNIVAKRLDVRLCGLAKKCNLQYTRYADDITFSGNNISVRFPEIVHEIIQDEGFVVNTEKTRLCRSRGKRVVTGLSVSGDKLKVPRNYKRRLRQEIHYILCFGYYSHVSKLKNRDPFYIDSIYGKLLFWNWVEPENSFVKESLPKISAIMRRFGVTNDVANPTKRET